VLRGNILLVPLHMHAIYTEALNVNESFQLMGRLNIIVKSLNCCY